MTLHRTPLWGRLVTGLAYGVAVLGGAKYGFDFGKEISGSVLGVVLAVNGAIFCSIVVSMVADRAFGPKPQDTEER